MMSKYFTFFFIAFMLFSCAKPDGQNVKEVAEKQAKQLDIPVFMPPQKQSEIGIWELTGKVMREQHPNKKYTPRGFLGTTGPEYNVYSFEGAIKDMLKDTGIKPKEKIVLTQMKAWKDVDGRDVRIALVPTEYENTDGVLFLFIAKLKNSKVYALVGLETTAKTFHDWEGVLQMMMIRGVIKTKSNFPEKYRNAIASTSFKNQINVYDASLTALKDQLVKRRLTQSQMTSRLMELNYDLLLGDDISNPMIGN